MISVLSTHYFPNEAARDAFFLSIIADETYCVIEMPLLMLQKYQNGVWVDVSPIKSNIGGGNNSGNNTCFHIPMTTQEVTNLINNVFAL